MMEAVMKMWLKRLTAVLILVTVAACTPGAPSPTSPEVIIQGNTPGREEVQTFELDNCTGKADAKRVEERAQSVDVTISAEIASEIGASVEVLSAEVEAAVGLALNRGAERKTAVELVAPPNTRMVIELVWVGDEQIGVVQRIRNSDIPVIFRSFSPTDFRIKSQIDIGCPDSSNPQVVVNATAISTTVTPFCAFVTQDQVEELKNFQDVPSAIKKAEEFAGHRQNDYTQGSTIPSGVLIATDVGTPDFEQFGLLAINSQGGYGLFMTSREIQAPNTGTYWCIQSAASSLQPNGINCAFIDELLVKADVIQQLNEGSGLAGIQARLLEPIDIPAGWVVHKDGQEYSGPIHLDADGVASFWAPVSCRPLSVNN
jgi:hypothetical protein